MRCFMAVEFDGPTKTKIAELQKKLANHGIKGNYSLTENLHLTLKFLGEVKETSIGVLTELMKKVADDHHGFVLKMDQLGKFSKGSKSILWLGIQNNPELTQMQGKLNEALLVNFSGNLERSSFSPHITLVREATLPETTQEAFWSNLKSLIGPINLKYSVKGISLMESTRIGGKLCYLMKSHASLMA